MGIRFATDGHQHLIRFQIQGVAVRITHLQGTVETQHAVVQIQFHAQLLQRFMHRLRQLSVIGRQNALLRLDHADFRAELAIGNAQLQTDISTADHDEAFWHTFRRQRFGGGDDRPANRQDRQVDTGRTGGQHQMLAVNSRVADFHGFAVDDVGPAVDDLNLVLLQQCGNAGGQAINNAVLPLDAFADVEGRRRNVDTQCRMLVVLLGLMKLLSHMDQRFRGNAANVQASAAQRLTFDQNGLNAQLPGANRRDVAAGAAANDQQRGVQGLHCITPQTALRVVRAGHEWPG